MNVIVVDDESSCLEHFVEKARRIETIREIDCFIDTIEAVNHVKYTDVDIAFLDVEMPSISGIELAKVIKIIRPSTHIIFVSAYSQYCIDAMKIKANGFLIKPVSEEEIRYELSCLSLRGNSSRNQPNTSVTENKVRIQAFGNFEVFVGNKPLKFRRSKSKEFLAYLVDRRGAGVNTGEIMAVLFENEKDSKTLRTMVRVIASDLRKSLIDAGAGEIIIKTRNQWKIDISKVNCDYYNFLNGDEAAINSYLGEYMQNYSWAEMTTGWLCETRECYLRKFSNSGM